MNRALLITWWTSCPVAAYGVISMPMPMPSPPLPTPASIQRWVLCPPPPRLCQQTAWDGINRTGRGRFCQVLARGWLTAHSGGRGLSVASNRRAPWRQHYMLPALPVTFHFSRYEAGFQGNIEFQMVVSRFFFAILSDKHQKLRMSCGKFEFSTCDLC